MAIKVHLEYELATADEPVRVTADMRDMRRWEMQNNGQPFSTDNPDLGRLTFIAWAAARREGRFSGSYMEFDANCTSVIDVAEEEVSPT